MLRSLFKAEADTAVRPARVVEADDVEALAPYEPAAWDQCFERSLDVDVPAAEGTFRVYVAGDLDALHASKGTALLLLHGAGHTSLVWAHFAAALKASGTVLIAYDARGHGASRHADEHDLSADRMVADCVLVAETLLLQHGCRVVLCGHSMGGAVAVRAAKKLSSDALRALVVMDVVEGTALASLSHIQLTLNSRPTHFSSPAQAVRWALDSKSVHAVGSARVSVPSQLRQQPDGGYAWRTDLSSSTEFWAGWYTDMSALFLSMPLPKLLLLAGTDRLDKALTVGQMQGKFQLDILPHCGHQLQEDDADAVAAKVSQFLRHFLRGL